MNWYSKNVIVKLAAAKDKIKRYNIINPSIKFFIHRYENVIPWNEIEKHNASGGNNEDYIQEYITSNLLPQLQSSITDDVKNPNNPDSNMMKPSNLPDEVVRDALRIELEGLGRPYDESALPGFKNIMIQDINTEKSKQFNSWWSHMNEQEVYTDDPAFKYSVLKPVIDSSPDDKKDSPPPLNAEILGGVWDDITNKGVDQMNILKRYKKLVVKAEKDKLQEEGVEETESGGSWVEIKGGENATPEELKENIDRLKNLSQGTGWCTARGMADRYLPQGDFHLYLKNDKAVVAIRQVGEKVQEIRGEGNQQENLDPYWQEVIQYLGEKPDIDYKDNRHYQGLQDIYLMNANLEQGSEEYKEVLRQVQSDHKVYMKMSEENKQKFPEFAQAASIGYRAELNQILSNVEERAQGGEYLFQFDKFQEQYEKIPVEIREGMPDVQERVLEVHKTAYNSNPNLFVDFPAELQQKFTPEEQSQGWIKYVEQDPYHYNDEKIPAEIRQLIPMESLMAKWKEMIAKNPDHIEYMSPDVLSKFPQGEIEGYILRDFASFPLATLHGKLVKLEKVELLVAQGKIDRQEIVNVFSEGLKRNPERAAQWAARIPEEYRAEVMEQGNVLNAVNVGEKEQVLRDIGHFTSMPPERQEALLQQFGAEIGQAFANTLTTHRGLYHNFWESIPPIARAYLPFDTIDATAQFYANEINNNPDAKDAILNEISPDIQPFVYGKLASGQRTWFKKASALDLQFLSYNSYGEFKVIMNRKTYSYNVPQEAAEKLQWMIEKSDIPGEVILKNHLKQFRSKQEPPQGYTEDEQTKMLQEMENAGWFDKD